MHLIPKQFSSIGPDYSIPAVADLDGDGFKEIIEGFANGELCIWDHVGNDYVAPNPIFSQSGYRLIMPPLVVDLNKDGQYEIFVMSSNPTTLDGQLFLIDIYGNIMTGWGNKTLTFKYKSTTSLNPCVAIGDIDRNDDLEVVFVNNDYLYVWNHDGTNFISPIFNEDLNFEKGSPLIADIDGGDDIEIIVPTGSGNIYAFKDNGDDVTGYPLRVKDNLISQPSIADLNNDGKSEIVCGNFGGEAFIWQTEGDPELIQWGTERFDNQNSGTHKTSCFVRKTPKF